MSFAKKDAKNLESAAPVVVEDEVVEQSTTEVVSKVVVVEEAKPTLNNGNKFTIDNNTASIAAFPELGSQPASTIKPYTTDVPVEFKDEKMFLAFTANLKQLSELAGWSGECGIILKGA